jgi:hypothetical protein
VAKTLNIAGTEVEIDFTKLSVYDAIKIEKMYGKSIDEWRKAGTLGAIAVGVLVLAQRTNPELTLKDFDNVSLDDLASAIASDEDPPAEDGSPNPTPAA